jgi:DNA-dependent RNA polymerase auxiliary subunit epsilon
MKDKKQPLKSIKTVKIPLPKRFKKEGNAFDKVIKEIIEKIFKPLVEEQLGIKILKFTPLKEKMQTTVELEMDFFYEIVPEIGETFILHLEFESGDNPNMVYRVGEYHGMALRRNKLPIKHIVIYLGMKSPKMRTQLRPEEIYTGFELLNARTLKTEELLSSQIPEVVLTAVLADYDPKKTEIILRAIVNNLKKLVDNDSELRKYINQLMMLSRLRKIEGLTSKITKEMPIRYNIKTDDLYLEGREEGREETAAQKDYLFVRNLLLNTDFSAEKIALLADVAVAYVQKVKLEISEGKS